MFAAFRRQPAPADIRLFAGRQPEILAVFNKPVPACNFAQTAGQTALRVARETRRRPKTSPTVSIGVPEAAARYPGCDSKGPFHNALQAKMSIHSASLRCSPAARLRRTITLMSTIAEILRLVERTELRSEPGLTAAFPAAQGAEILVGAAQRNNHPSAPRQCRRRDAGANPRPLSAGCFRRHRRQARTAPGRTRRQLHIASRQPCHRGALPA